MSEDIMMVEEYIDEGDRSMEDDYEPEEIASRVLLNEPPPEDEDENSDVDIDYIPAEDDDMDDDSVSSDDGEDFNPEEEIEVNVPSTSKKGVPPIDYEGIMNAYNAGNHEDEEEAEFSDGEDSDDDSSSSSDELEEKHDPESIRTAVMLQEPDDEDEDVDDRGFVPKKGNFGVVVKDPGDLKAQVEQITANTNSI